jgi:hypothetical protein
MSPGQETFEAVADTETNTGDSTRGVNHHSMVSYSSHSYRCASVFDRGHLDGDHAPAGFVRLE